MNFDNFLNPPEIEPMMVECDNERCSRGRVSYEDASQDMFDNWICDWCADNGYKSADQINYDCDLDDDEIVKRTRVVSLNAFRMAGTFTCPSCNGDPINTELFHLFYVPRIDAPLDMPDNEW